MKCSLDISRSGFANLCNFLSSVIAVQVESILMCLIICIHSYAYKFRLPTVMDNLTAPSYGFYVPYPNNGINCIFLFNACNQLMIFVSMLPAAINFSSPLRNYKSVASEV
jgi:hypothetical protein